MIAPEPDRAGCGHVVALPSAVTHEPVFAANAASHRPSPLKSPDTSHPGVAGECQNGWLSPCRYQSSLVVTHARSALPSPSKSYGTARGGGLVVVVVVGGGLG